MSSIQPLSMYSDPVQGFEGLVRIRAHIGSCLHVVLPICLCYKHLWSEVNTACVSILNHHFNGQPIGPGCAWNSKWLFVSGKRSVLLYVVRWVSRNARAAYSWKYLGSNFHLHVTNQCANRTEVVMQWFEVTLTKLPVYLMPSNRTAYNKSGIY